MSDEKKQYFAGDSGGGPFFGEPCDTPEEAIQEYFEENGRYPGTVGVGREVHFELDGESILENAAEHLWDELYEDALDDWPGVERGPSFKELSKRLTATATEWLKEQGVRTSWTVISEIECDIPVNEDDGDAV